MSQITIVFDQLNNVAAIPPLTVEDPGTGPMLGVTIATGVARHMMGRKRWRVAFVDNERGAISTDKGEPLIPFVIQR